jgi:arylsulfatase A-like enzyme
VHFGEVDGVGHGIGWGTREQIARIETSDARLGVVLKGIDDAGLRDHTAVILSADHGGSGRQHGRDDLRSRHIPWVCVGPGIAQGFDLTFYRDLTINTEDTFATACWLLNLDAGSNLDGKPVKWVLEEKGELLEATPGISTQPQTRQ